MNRRDFIKSAIIGAAGVSVPLGVTAYEPVRYVEHAPVVVPPDAPISGWPCYRRTLKWNYTLSEEGIKRLQEYMATLYDLDGESDTPIVSTQIVLNS